MGKAPPGRGRQWSIVNSRARPNADPFGVESMGPLRAGPYRTAAIPARGTRKARLARVNAFR